MKLLDQLHEGYVHDRRTSVLTEVLAGLAPRDASILDVGCGDGLISKLIQEKRPDVRIEGIDVLVRPQAHIPVAHFDGEQLPFPDASFDAVMFVDVLHHTVEPLKLLREAARVTRGTMLIKDHTRDGILAGPTLHFMDWVGNARHGVSIPANYWPEARWLEAFRNLNLTVNAWTHEVPLYPWWASWVFGRSLHFVTSLSTRG